MKPLAIPFHRPSIGAAEERAVRRALRSGWLTSGPEAERFEREFARAVGTRQAVAVASGTAALHLALAAAGVGPGDEVVVPTMTFAASAEVVWRLGARPVLADCEPATLNLTPEVLAGTLAGRRRVRAVMPVHYGGRPCAMDQIRALARAAGLAVVADAAHAFGAEAEGGPVGASGLRAQAVGEATCFSFYATKNITTGEGGMIATGSPAAALRMRRLRLHGLRRRAGSLFYDIAEPGFKYNLPDLAAALGRAQLRRAAAFLRARRRLAAFYEAALGDLEEIETPPPAPGHAWHLYTIQLRLPRLRHGRDAFWAELGRRGIGASVHFRPLHLHSFYRRAGYRDASLPVATAVYPRLLSLPIYPDLTPRQAERVATTVRELARRWRR